MTVSIFKCHICSMEFKRKYNLERHVTTVHNDEARFECGQCERKYKRKRDLDRHVNDAHLKVRPFVCGECGLSFAGAEQLRKHRKEKHSSGSNAESAAAAAATSAGDMPLLMELLDARQASDFQLADDDALAGGGLLSIGISGDAAAEADADANASAHDVQANALLLKQHVHCDDCGHVAVVHEGHVDWIVDGRLETADHEDHGIAPDEKTLNEWLNQLFGAETAPAPVERRVLLK